MPHKGFGSRTRIPHGHFSCATRTPWNFSVKFSWDFFENCEFWMKNYSNYHEQKLCVWLDDSVCDRIKSRLNTDLITCFWFWFCDSNCITVSCCFWERSQSREMECRFRNDSKTIKDIRTHSSNKMMWTMVWFIWKYFRGILYSLYSIEKCNNFWNENGILEAEFFTRFGAGHRK